MSEAQLRPRTHREHVGQQIRDELLPRCEEIVDGMIRRNRKQPGGRWACYDARRCLLNLRKILQERPLAWWADQAHRTPTEVVRAVLERIQPYYS